MSEHLNKFVNKKGTYILVIFSSSKKSIPIGRLGRMKLKPGWYIYVGSAFGSGGLSARLKRHLKKEKKCYWHIDYLLKHTDIKEIWFTSFPINLEDKWVKIISSMSNNNIPIKNFGSSDSNSISHLFYFRRRPSLRMFKSYISKEIRLVYMNL
jgi:Uri superfamily endonuclease